MHDANYQKLASEFIGNSLKLTTLVQQHEDLIKDPKGAMEAQGKGDWDSLDPRRQKHLLEKKWPEDIKRQKEQINIVEGILSERG